MLSPAVHAEEVATKVVRQEGGRFVWCNATDIALLTNTIILIIPHVHLVGVRVSEADCLEHTLRVAVVALQENLAVPLHRVE